MSDDQNILALNWAGSTSGGDDGGRKGDRDTVTDSGGQAVFFNQNITDGSRDFMLDPATTWGDYVFPWDDFWLTPFYYMARDHYVSFPMTMSVGTATETADITAVNIPGEQGPFGLPDWDDFDTYPSTRVYLFQPGINTWEFLVGDNETDGKVYNDPETGMAVNQVHGGSGQVASGTPCTGCHTVRIADGSSLGGSMEAVAGQRGGVWTDTPVD